jgi:hypothetical protein
VRWYHWLWLPIVVIVAVLAFVLGRRNMDLSSTISTEMDVMQARAEAKKVAATLGAVRAAEEIERAHAATLAKLDTEARDEATRLRSDPAALAAYLVRAGSGSS